MPGPSLSGNISIFGTDPSLGIHDPSDSGHTATGISESLPGIAVYNQQTKGGYWLVKTNGRQAILRQTDIGPAPYTHRVVDFTPKGGQALGLNPHNFPTDSKAQLQFLSHDLGEAQRLAKGVTFAGGGGPAKVGGIPGVPGTPASTSSQFDQGGFQQAQKLQTLAGLVKSSYGTDNPLFSLGVLSTNPVNPGDFQKTVTTPATPGIPGLPTAPSVSTGPGRIINPSQAQAPAGAPPQVQRFIDAANSIAHKPYVYGGGHGGSLDQIASAYDCSSSTTFALHHAGLFGSQPAVSGDLQSYGQAGPGKWITIYAHSGHVFVVVKGVGEWNTAGHGGGVGPRWQPDGTYSKGGFTVRHPPGL